MNTNIQIFPQLPKVNVCDHHSQQTEQMYNGREDEKNILSYVHFERLCNFIKIFTEFNKDFVKEGITFSF